MRPTVKSVLLALLCLGTPLTTMAQSAMFETFETDPETRWRLIADTVMGGVSQGDLRFLREDGQAHARLTGTVSTANNGGFIQMRTDLPAPPPEKATGVRLVLRGNDQRYFVHLRTGGTVLPWQYYQAGFHAPRDWTEIRLPFAAFRPSGRLLRVPPRNAGIKSVGIVAFGRDHEAEIELREVGFY